MKIPAWVLLPFFLLLVVLDFLSALKRDAEPMPPAEENRPAQEEAPDTPPDRRSDQRSATKGHHGVLSNPASSF